MLILQTIFIDADTTYLVVGIGGGVGGLLIVMVVVVVAVVHNQRVGRLSM